MIKNQTIEETSLRSLNSEVSTAGRVVSFRRMGNVAFCHIQDSTSRLQLCFRRDDMGGADIYKPLVSEIIIGCHIQVKGGIWETSTLQAMMEIRRVIYALNAACRKALLITAVARMSMSL